MTLTLKPVNLSFWWQQLHPRQPQCSRGRPRVGRSPLDLRALAVKEDMVNIILKPKFNSDDNDDDDFNDKDLDEVGLGIGQELSHVSD